MRKLAEWWRARCVNRLLIRRAGLVAIVTAFARIERIAPTEEAEIARIDELLRQSGHPRN